VIVGESVTLDGSNSHAPAGGVIASYQWAITSGASLASFSGATNGATAALVPSAAGTVTVSLTVIDGTGRSDTTSTTVTVTSPPPVSSGGGGGGAMELGWLLGWLASVIGVRVVTPRPRRECA